MLNINKRLRALCKHLTKTTRFVLPEPKTLILKKVLLKITKHNRRTSDQAVEFKKHFRDLQFHACVLDVDRSDSERAGARTGLGRQVGRRTPGLTSRRVC